MNRLKAWLSFIRGSLWPALVILLLCIYNQELTHLLRSVTHLKTEWFEADLNTTNVAISIRDVLLSLLEQKTQTEGPRGPKEEIDEDTVRQIAQVFSDINPNFTNLPGKRILWLDPSPDHNVDLINAFQALGIRVFLSATNADAKRRLKYDSYSLIITNMARPKAVVANPKLDRFACPEPGPDYDKIYADGVEFLAYLRENNPHGTPVIVYANCWGWKHHGEEGEFGVKLIAPSTASVYTTTLTILANDDSYGPG